MRKDEGRKALDLLQEAQRRLRAKGNGPAAHALAVEIAGFIGTMDGRVRGQIADRHAALVRRVS